MIRSLGPKRALVVAIAMLLSSFIAASPAEANFGDETTTPPNGSPGASLANNKRHAVRRDNMNSTWFSEMVPGIVKLNATDMSAYVTTSDPYPDVWAQNFWFGVGGPWAQTACPTNNSGYGGPNLLQWCRGQTIRYNSADAFASNFLKFMGCHELGHTVGLRHRNGDWGCMEERGPGSSSYPSDYTNHDKLHINGWY